MDKSLDEIIGSSDASQVKSSGSKPSKASGSRGSRSSRGVSKGGAKRSGAKGAGTKGFKAVFIRNLSEAVTEDDLRDLFRQVGPVVRVHVERTDSGKRTGLAWVLYDYAEDALVAAGRYNQRRAAGQIITVRQVAHVGDTGSGLGPLSDRIGDRAKSSTSRSGRSRRRGRGSKGDDAKPNPSRSAADLDAELDAYMQVESNVPMAADQSGSSAAAPAPASETAPRPAEDSMIDV